MRRANDEDGQGGQRQQRGWMIAARQTRHEDMPGRCMVYLVSVVALAVAVAWWHGLYVNILLKICFNL